jgi:uncharacterized small protein (DUF1192 family)
VSTAFGTRDDEILGKHIVRATLLLMTAGELVGGHINIVEREIERLEAQSNRNESHIEIQQRELQRLKRKLELLSL